MSRRSQLDALDLTIVTFQEALDELAEIADKFDRFADIFEQLLEKEASTGDDR